jgi:hypothetical protein
MDGRQGEHDVADGLKPDDEDVFERGHSVRPTAKIQGVGAGFCQSTMPSGDS